MTDRELAKLLPLVDHDCCKDAVPAGFLDRLVKLWRVGDPAVVERESCAALIVGWTTNRGIALEQVLPLHPERHAVLRSAARATSGMWIAADVCGTDFHVEQWRRLRRCFAEGHRGVTMNNVQRMAYAALFTAEGEQRPIRVCLPVVEEWLTLVDDAAACAHSYVATDKVVRLRIA